MDQSSKDELITASVLGGLSQAVAHWFPWNRAIGKELQPPWTYIIGLTQILGIYATWATRRRRITGRDAVTGLLAITAGSGLSVVLGYIVDWCFGKRLEEQVRQWGQTKRSP